MAGHAELQYRKTLIETAQIEQSLLHMVFDPVTRQRIDRYDHVKYNALLQQLEKKQDQLWELLRNTGRFVGVYWWNVPWTDVESAVIFSLQKECECSDWRTVCNWIDDESECLHRLFSSTDRIHRIFVSEEGHFSDFTGSQSTTYSRRSRYSQSEQDDMIRDYQSKIQRSKAYDIATIDGPVYSSKYDKVYGSAKDYYDSTEYRAAESLWSDIYAKSLYTDVETVNLGFYSNSRHYNSLHQAGGYTLSKDGTVTHLHSAEFKIIRAVGNARSDAGISLSLRYPAIVCCGYLAQADQVLHIPAEVFGGAFTQDVLTYNEALRCAAMFSCISHKLTCDPDFMPTYETHSAEKQKHYAKLFTDLENGASLSVEDLLTIRNVLIQKVFPFEQKVEYLVNAVVIKNLLVHFVNEKDFVSALYYAPICADAAVDALRLLQHPDLWEITLVSSAHAAECLLQAENKPKAKQYAELSLRAWDELSSIVPGHPVLKLKRTCEKLLKRASRH